MFLNVIPYNPKIDNFIKDGSYFPSFCLFRILREKHSNLFVAYTANYPEPLNSTEKKELRKLQNAKKHNKCRVIFRDFFLNTYNCLIKG